MDPQWSQGPDSPGWRMVYAFATTGRLDHAWSLMLQIDLQSSISAQTKEIVNGWVQLLRGGTFVGGTLLEASMDAVEQRADDTGREVCTFMNLVRPNASAWFHA